MMITETDAKKKWCPLVRICPATENHHALTNRFDAVTSQISYVPTLCIASECMAWRTGIWDHQRNLLPEDRTPGVGYCGAFGRPA